MGFDVSKLAKTNCDQHFYIIRKQAEVIERLKKKVKILERKLITKVKTEKHRAECNFRHKVNVAKEEARKQRRQAEQAEKELFDARKVIAKMKEETKGGP